LGRCSQHRCNGWHSSAQCLDDAHRRDVLGAIVDDVELLVMLIVTGLRVRVIVDDLDCPLAVLELHLLIVVLVGNMLLAFWLKGRHDVTVRLLLLLLTEMFHELLDLSTLHSAMAPRVVHQVQWPTLITIGGLVR
jgi:hypothetical protein